MSRPKAQLGQIIREAGKLFTVDTAAGITGKSSTETAKILARWAKQGWLVRVKRGLYAVIPIEASTTDQFLEDAWLMIPDLFTSCYLGGWTAAEHWHLTDQVFRSICVMTERPPAKKNLTIHHIDFVITKIPARLMFGTKTVWKEDKKILISDPEKTLIDMLYKPELGGGIQHVVDCFREYNLNEQKDYNLLKEYAVRLNNGATFKRLGFIAESILGESHELTLACRQRLTKGNTYFDPKLKERKLITRWRLFVPESFGRLYI